MVAKEHNSLRIEKLVKLAIIVIVIGAEFVRQQPKFLDDLEENYL
jgi:hypothetical protein